MMINNEVMRFDEPTACKAHDFLVIGAHVNCFEIYLSHCMTVSIVGSAHFSVSNVSKCVC